MGPAICLRDTFRPIEIQLLNLVRRYNMLSKELLKVDPTAIQVTWPLWPIFDTFYYHA